MREKREERSGDIFGESISISTSLKEGLPCFGCLAAFPKLAGLTGLRLSLSLPPPSCLRRTVITDPRHFINVGSENWTLGFGFHSWQWWSSHLSTRVVTSATWRDRDGARGAETRYCVVESPLWKAIQTWVWSNRQFLLVSLHAHWVSRISV